jgi:hypothetical protein
MRQQYIKRNQKGALLAEYVTTLYVLFFMILIPMLNYATIGLNTFGLWFAANQAVMAASKCKTYSQTVYVPIAPPNTAFYGAQTVGQAKALQVKAMFPGINWTQTPSNPNVEVVFEPVNPANGVAQTYSATQMLAGTPGNRVPNSLLNVFDYVVSCRVVLTGTAAPLIPISWLNIPGLSSPMTLTVASQAQYENPITLTVASKVQYENKVGLQY